MNRTFAILLLLISVSCSQVWENPVIESFSLVRNSSSENSSFYPTPDTIGVKLTIVDNDNDLKKIVMKKYQDAGSGFASATLLSSTDIAVTGSGPVTYQNYTYDTAAVLGKYYYEAVPVDDKGNSGVSKVMQANVIVEPAISPSVASHDFGNQATGTSSSPYTITITNTSASIVRIGAIAITGTNASDFEIDSDSLSSTTLAAAAGNTIDIVFSPATAGAKTATLNIPYGHFDIPYLQITLTGTGL